MLRVPKGGTRGGGGYHVEGRHGKPERLHEGYAVALHGGGRCRCGNGCAYYGHWYYHRSRWWDHCVAADGEAANVQVMQVRDGVMQDRQSFHLELSGEDATESVDVTRRSWQSL